MMDFDNDEINYYEVIKCTIESTKEEIGRAVRKLSVKYHPDKNKAPEAAEIFLKIQKCKEFLLDDTKRKEYDEKYKKVAKRKEYDAKRYQSMDSRRKRMREELEERLGKAQKPAPQNTNFPSDNTTQSERRSKKAELDRIRKDGQERVHAAASKLQQDHTDSIEEISRKLRARETEQVHLAAQAATVEEVSLQIKVKWKRSAESHSDDSLATIFRRFGSIEEISILPGKGASAVITFSEPSAAPAAVLAFESSKVFRVNMYGEPKKATVFTHVYSSNASMSASTSSMGRGESSHFSNNAFVESDLMREVRRTMERETLLRELQQQDNAGAQQQQHQEHHQNFHASSTSFVDVDTHASSSSDSVTVKVYVARDMPSDGGARIDLESMEKDILPRMIQFAASHPIRA